MAVLVTFRKAANKIVALLNEHQEWPVRATPGATLVDIPPGVNLG
jgi:hypothetical protein